MRGRRTSSWGLQKRWQAWGIWRGSETMHFAWEARWFRALWCRCLKPPTLNPWKGCKFHVTEVLLCSDHFAWQLQEFVCLGSTFSWQAQHFWSIHFKIVKTYWNSEVKCPVNFSFFKEVSQKCFAFDLQSFFFEGSLAQKLRFWASKLHFWRKSRTKASFSSFKASFLKEVSHKSFVFELQSFIFEGSLVEKLRFWALKFPFWRTSRRKASFLTFKANQSHLFTKSGNPFEFRGNHLKFRSVNNHIIWLSNQLTIKSLEVRNHLTTKSMKLKSLDNQNYLKLNPRTARIIWVARQLTIQPLEFQVSWQPNHLTFTSIDNVTKSFESQINCPPSHFNFKSVDNQIIWISNRLTTKSFGSQIISQPIPLNLKSIDYQTSCPWISNQLITKPFESQSIDSQNQLIQTSEDNPAVWISNQFTTQPFEFQIRWQPNPWNFKSTAISNRLTNKSLQSHNNWQPTHLNLKERWTNKPQIKWHSKSVRNQATWSDINWFSHQRHTPSSYRFFMVGNFRHRLARSICYMYLLYVRMHL